MVAAVSKRKNKENFIDDYVKQTKWQVGAKYNTLIDWNKCCDKRGKWLKSPKITFTESVMSENKKRPKPAPTHYNLKLEFDKMSKSSKPASVGGEKFCSFIEQAKFNGS
jgi:hypothetical protein